MNSGRDSRRPKTTRVVTVLLVVLAVAGVAAFYTVSPVAEAESGVMSMELLAEENVDHDHACLHALHDERTPLTASQSVANAPTVDDTHVIWDVTYEGDGYVRFDADSHHYDGPFVFYTYAGTVELADGTETGRDDVPDEDCEPLDEYVVVEVPDDGMIELELVADDKGELTVRSYANQDGIVDTDGLRDAVDDWRVDKIDTDLLQDVVDAWETGESVD